MTLDALVAIEANAATDNPMVFADADDIVSGGTFHARRSPSAGICWPSPRRSSPRSASAAPIGW